MYKRILVPIDGSGTALDAGCGQAPHLCGD